MKALVEAYRQLIPCGHPPQTPSFVQCPESIALMASGGDRLAEYLIRHVKAHEGESYYVLLLGRTQSPVAVDFLLKRVRAEEGLPANERYVALDALGNTRSLEAAQYAAELMEQTDDEQLLVYAVNMLDQAQRKHGPFEAMQPKLRALAERVKERQRASGRRADPDIDVVQRIERVLREPGHTE